MTDAYVNHPGGTSIVGPVCGICRKRKFRKQYNKHEVGVVMGVVYLCKRCDLTPAPVKKS